MQAKYETIQTINGLDYEVVDTDRGGIFQACTFGIEMVPNHVRRVLGTFNSRAEALARINHEIIAVSSSMTEPKK